MMMFNRLYHVSSVAFSFKKQGMKLNKLLNPKPKKQWYPSNMYDGEMMPSVKSLTKVERVPGKQGIRRLAMLNKLFMKSITDLMSTGTIAMDIVGRGIEISKVKVSSDFKTVNVYWVCKGDLRDVETEALLNKTAGVLRHELSTLRVMGEVPYIVFVKDQQESQVVELDRRLAQADYGEDYVPTEMGHILKTEFTLDTKLSPEMKAKIKQLEDELEMEEDPIPEMTHNVYGLDHAKIMNRLLAARKKTRDAWVNLDMDGPVISYRTGDNPSAEINDVGQQKRDLADFLLKRQILQNKLHKQRLDSREELLALDKDDDTAHDDVDEEFDEEDEDDYDYESETTYYTGITPDTLHCGGKETPKL